MAETQIALTFSVNRLILAEKETGKTIAEIVQELETGAPSFTTLRALVAVGRIPERYIQLGGPMGTLMNVHGAGETMEKMGTKSVSSAIGQAMSAFLETIGR